MKYLATLAAVTMSAFAFGQSFEHDIATEKKPWTNLEANADPDDFQFIIVTDRTGGHRPGVFMDGVRKINLMQPEFVMSVGDLIEGYTEDRDRLNAEWTEFIGFVEQLEMPFFYVPGNHDITNMVMKEEWEKRFGPTYYHFVYRDVLFLCLNSEDPPSSQMSDEQVAYVKKALAENTDVKWTMVFIHKPLWSYGDPKENGFAEVEAALQGRPHNVFAGHTHHYFKHLRQDSEYIVLATMGGGSQLRGQNYGEFDHFMWVTMTDDGPRIANLMLDGIWDTNVMSEERMALIRPAISGASVKIDGMVVDAEEFEEAATTVRIVNDADIEMTAEVVLMQDGAIAASENRFTAKVAPNSVELFDLTFVAEEAVPTESIKPIIAKWHVKYQPDGHVQPVDVRGRHRIVIDSAFDAIAADDIEVDGSLRDWDGLRIVPAGWGQIQGDEESYTGAYDAAIRFDVRADVAYVYVGVHAQDDQHVRDRRPEYWRRDSLLVYLDARPEGERMGGTANVDWLMIPLMGNLEETNGLQPEVEGLPEGLLTGVERDGDDVSYEVAIPRSYLDEAQGGEATSFRVNISQVDRDNDGTLRYSWRPAWDTDADFKGSGTFALP